jgi:4-hydroxyphenylpyruvate 3-dimethylallyltransferase
VSSSFSERQFFEDIRSTAAALRAPFSEDVTRKVLEIFADDFSTGATVWKTTERPGDPLSYRFFARSRTDNIGAALRSGLLAEENDCTALMTHWTEAYPSSAQSCDFDAINGIAKTWLYLGRPWPATEILGQPFVPATLRDHIAAFHRAGLDYVRFVAADYRHRSVNVYFRARGPISMAQCARILALVDVTLPAPELIAEMRSFLPDDFCVAVTVSLGTGRLERACFYVVGLPAGRFPTLPERVSRFFAVAPSLDATTVNVVGWSFGRTGGTYIKAEKGYVGDMAALLHDWDSYFSGSSQRDPVLTAAANHV